MMRRSLGLAPKSSRIGLSPVCRNFLLGDAKRRLHLNCFNRRPSAICQIPNDIGSNSKYVSNLSIRTFQSESKGRSFPPDDHNYVDTQSNTQSVVATRSNSTISSPRHQGANFNGLQQEFPCLLKNPSSGPEPAYDRIISGYKTYTYSQPFHLKYNNGVLPELKIAYETWGELNEDRSNVVLLTAGLSASSHAKSHVDNEKPGWWEKFIGPGCAIDTDKFFVICTNTLGGCYGSSGPSTVNPETGSPYGTTFPLVSVFDMVNAQFVLLDHLGIDKVYATVGSSLGGMCSLTAAVQYPDRVGRMMSISSCAWSHPSSIAMRYLQRKCIMTDSEWKNGHYYGTTFPRNGMKMARELATMTYRSGPEWDERFARKRIDPDANLALCPTFLIENYLDYQGEMFCTMYDPNSLLYVSKAMDLFDIREDFSSMNEAMQNIKCPIMVLGVTTDILFPIWQQRELAAACRTAGNQRVTFYELDSIYGHDTFLLDLNGVGSAVKGFLETKNTVSGRARARKDRATS